MKQHKILYLALSAFTLQMFTSCEKMETVDNTAWVLTWSDEFNEPPQTTGRTPINGYMI